MKNAISSQDLSVEMLEQRKHLREAARNIIRPRLD